MRLVASIHDGCRLSVAVDGVGTYRYCTVVARLRSGMREAVGRTPSTEDQRGIWPEAPIARWLPACGARLAVTSGMRTATSILPLVLCVALLGTARAGEWSGTIEVVQTLSGREVKAGDRRELDAVTADYEGRLAAARERLKQATPSVARVLREDIGTLEAELERVALERGGTVHIGRTTYVIDGNRVFWDGDEAKVVLDHGQGRARIASGTRRDLLPLKAVPEPHMPDDREEGKPLLGRPTVVVTIKAEDRTFTVRLIAGLPNPYAQTLLPDVDGKSLQAVLARLPGLPAEVEARDRNLVQRWTVQRIDEGHVDQGVFTE
jgi:hypothetical protein